MYTKRDNLPNFVINIIRLLLFFTVPQNQKIRIEAEMLPKRNKNSLPYRFSYISISLKLKNDESRKTITKKHRYLLTILSTLVLCCIYCCPTTIKNSATKAASSDHGNGLSAYLQYTSPAIRDKIEITILPPP